MKTAQSALFALMLGLLCACSQAAEGEYAYVDEKVEVELQAASPASGSAPAPDVVVPQLAYEYSYGFQSSDKGIEALSAADQAACEKAGPTQCQMISLTTQNSTDHSWASRSLELRVSPQWLETWRAGLSGSLKANNARITDESVTSEDLSLRIVDTEAHIQNREALRDRLQTIIRTHSGKVSELVEAETQLSQVQHEIDSARSSLAIMQKRVATVKLSLSYRTEAAASSHTFEPVVRAVKGSLRAFMEALGVLIMVIAYLAPLAIIGIPAVIFARKWLASRRKPPRAD